MSSAVVALLLGAIVGSFLNVVALRYNTGATICGRSRCFSCSTTIQWFDLVPIVSFIALRGRCRRCGSAISVQYPLVEMITGVIFALVFWRVVPSSLQDGLFLLNTYYLILTTYYWVVFSLLIAISVYDLRHKIIPNGLVYLFITLAFLNVLGVLNFESGILNLIGNWKLPALRSLGAGGEIGNLISGPFLAAPFALLWLLSRGRWMGLGDAKLALGIGWLLGFLQGLAALAFSFWLGALVSIGVLFGKRLGLFSSWTTVTMKSEIPFGPFLVLGTFLVWFFGLDVAALVGWF